MAVLLKNRVGKILATAGQNNPLKVSKAVDVTKIGGPNIILLYHVDMMGKRNPLVAVEVNNEVVGLAEVQGTNQTLLREIIKKTGMADIQEVITKHAP